MCYFHPMMYRCLIKSSIWQHKNAWKADGGHVCSIYRANIFIKLIVNIKIMARMFRSCCIWQAKFVVNLQLVSGLPPLESCEGCQFSKPNIMTRLGHLGTRMAEIRVRWMGRGIDNDVLGEMMKMRGVHHMTIVIELLGRYVEGKDSSWEMAWCEIYIHPVQGSDSDNHNERIYTN